MNTEAFLTQDPLLQEAPFCEKPVYYQLTQISDWNCLNDKLHTLGKSEQRAANLVPRVCFNLRKLKFGVIWVHALYFFSGWCSQDL